MMASLHAMPKVLLHEHLDGSLRDQTLLELLAERGLPCPAADATELGRWFDDRAHAGSLVEYLRGFDLTVAAIATPQALERVAFEAAEDALADGCVLAEFRIAPLLFERFGLSGDDTVAALVRGLRRSTLPSGLIVCSMRHLPSSETMRAARLALAWADRGVIAFDLAGAEFGHPPSEHGAALALVREAGMPLTLHAGEADAATRVLEAVQLGANRIGHGIRVVDAIGRDEALVAVLRNNGVHLEVCPTSNVHTGAAASIATHPIAALWQAGLSLSVNTDNRQMSRISLTSEYEALLAQTALTHADLQRMNREAAKHSFLPERVRAAALARLEGQPSA